MLRGWFKEAKGGEKYKFGAWVFCVKSSTLYCNKQSLKLNSQTAELLEYFLLNAFKTISIEELKLALWNKKEVSDASIYQAISTLRKCLGFSGEPSGYLRTIPKMGYSWELKTEKQFSPLHQFSKWLDRHAGE